jgi:hypothetical protein
MTNDIDKNKEICRRLALHWHEGIICSCGVDLLMWPGKYQNPDFVRHPVGLLLLLVNRKDYEEFLRHVINHHLSTLGAIKEFIDKAITDQSGLLADAFLEFTETNHADKI